MKEDMNDTSKSPIKISSKNLTIIVVVAVVVVAGLLYLFLHNGAKKHAEATPNPGYYQTEDELNNNKHQVEVNLTADGPAPQTLRVSVDTEIGWHNQDSKEHEIAISPGTTVPDQFYNFRKIAAGGGYLFVIRKAGTYHYYDVNEPTHTGEIIVSN